MATASTSARAGTVSPRRLPFAYRAGLLLAACVMLLLPAIYVGLIVGVGWLVVLWLEVGIVLMSSPGFFGLVLYLAPAIAGGILILFMLKPLFLRPGRGSGPLKIDPLQHPELTNYVRSVSEAVGAPMPSEILVDCAVNASASFRRGWLGIVRGQLSLTIGLPLAADLSAAEMAVVIAHEFGHFAQRGGMVATYLVNSINGWFSRVVFQRDTWDLWLAQNSRRGHWSSMLVLAIAKGGILVGRRTLFLLMHVGRASSCYLLRQMEYDADYYAVQAVGVDAYLTLGEKISLLSVAGGRAQADLSVMWNEKRLVDDLPALVARRRADLPADVLSKLKKAGEEQKPKWSDTHPTRAQREAKARALNAPGLLTFEGRARDRFTDFEALCREATWHHYTVVLKVKVERSNLAGLGDATRLGDEQQREQRALADLAPGLVDCRRPVIPLEATGTAEDLLRELRIRRSWLAEHRAELTAAQADFDRHAIAWDNANVAKTFIEAGVRVKPASFDLVDSSRGAAELKLDSAARGRDAAAATLAGGDQALAVWLGAGVALGRLLEKADGAIGAAARELADAETVRRGLGPLWTSMVELRRSHVVMVTFRHNSGSLGGNLAFKAELARRRESVEALIASALKPAAELPLPGAMTGRPMTVAEFVDLANRNDDLYQRIHDRANILYALHTRLIGRLAACIEVLEKSAA